MRESQPLIVNRDVPQSVGDIQTISEQIENLDQQHDEEVDEQWFKWGIVEKLLYPNSGAVPFETNDNSNPTDQPTSEQADDSNSYDQQSSEQ